MIEDDVDVIVQWYDRFIIGMVYAKKLLECEWITKEQF